MLLDFCDNWTELNLAMFQILCSFKDASWTKHNQMNCPLSTQWFLLYFSHTQQAFIWVWKCSLDYFHSSQILHHWYASLLLENCGRNSLSYTARVWNTFFANDVSMWTFQWLNIKSVGRIIFLNIRNNFILNITFFL